MGAQNLGPLVLAGSGEYTDTMDIVDRYLLDIIGGRPVVLIATACAPEGDERMTWWEQLGVRHFRKFGVEAIPVRIRNQAEADNEKHAEIIAGAGLVWFSGGSAAYLAQQFEGTRSWEALEQANRNGAAVAGASGGLGVLNSNAVQVGTNLQPVPGPTGLGLAAPVRAMSHFDRFAARRPEMVERAIANLQPGQRLAGVDEDTALVWSEGAWRAMGHKRVQVFDAGAEPRVYHHGDVIDALPPPGREPHPPAPSPPGGEGESANLTPGPPLRPAERGSEDGTGHGH